MGFPTKNGDAMLKRGFTLIELLVVLAIVAMLLTLATPRYFQSIDTSKQNILVENLRQTRDVLDKFYADTGRYPESLDELVERKYLKSLPYDPVTQSSKTWIILPPKGSERGAVYNIQSGAPGLNRYGVPYAEL
jgi:general secretion pathway protein G